MSMRKGMKPEDATDPDAPRKLTLVENAILTIQVLAGFGLMGAALWGISLWTSAR